MQTQEQEIQHIEITVEELQAKIDLADALERLHKNRDFKKLILTNYFEKRAIELVKGTTQATINETSEKIHRQALVGISSLQGYFHAIFKEGELAADSLEEHNAMLNEVRADG